MRNTLFLALIGFLLSSVLFEPGFSAVRFGLLRGSTNVQNAVGTGAVPHILVDGNLSDWVGVYPIINGTSGDRSSPYFYGITECYVLVEQDQLYFVFQKQPGGSDSWQMLFCTDFSNETGYPVNGVHADYMLQMSVGHAFFRWGGSDWVDSGLNVTVDYSTLHGGGRTADGSLVFAYGSYGMNNAYEWYEGKISLSLLGNPTVFGLIFELPWEHIVAPETGYIVIVQSQSLSLAASFTGNPTLHIGRPEHMIFNLLNFGPSDVSNATLEISLPEKLAVTSGQTSWQGAIPVGGRLTLDFQEEPLDYGYVTSYSGFVWVDPSSSGNRTFSIPLTTEAVPSISLGIDAPYNLTMGLESSMNITVSNLDNLTVPLTLETDGPYSLGSSARNVSLVLSPYSTVQFVSLPVIPTASGFTYFGVRAAYNGTGLGEAYCAVNVFAPRIYLLLNDVVKMQVGAVANVSTVIENEENVSFEAVYSIDLEASLVALNGTSANITLPPNSNTTVTVQVKAEHTGFYDEKEHLNGTYGELAYPEYTTFDVEPAPLDASIIVAVATIAVLILAVAVLTWRRKIKSKKTGEPEVSSGESS